MEFSIFREQLKLYYQQQNINLEVPDDNFLCWLIGFAEGDGSFIINKRNELSFVLVQGAANKRLLENVFAKLQLGHIIKQSERV